MSTYKRMHANKKKKTKTKKKRRREKNVFLETDRHNKKIKRDHWLIKTGD